MEVWIGNQELAAADGTAKFSRRLATSRRFGTCGWLSRNSGRPAEVRRFWALRFAMSTVGRYVTFDS